MPKLQKKWDLRLALIHSVNFETTKTKCCLSKQQKIVSTPSQNGLVRIHIFLKPPNRVVIIFQYICWTQINSMTFDKTTPHHSFFCVLIGHTLLIIICCNSFLSPNSIALSAQPHINTHPTNTIVCVCVRSQDDLCHPYIYTYLRHNRTRITNTT